MTDGYSREKAEKLIKEHEEKARKHDEESKRWGGSAGAGAEDARKAREERQKAENLRALQRSWGDKPTP